MENIIAYLKKHTLTLLIILLIIGSFLRFYNLNWGAPFYFHPDERNVASSVSQLRFPDQLNPKFFAYGSLPIYTIFFTGFFKNLFLYCINASGGCHPVDMSDFHFMQTPGWQLLNHISFSDAIIISRLFSALLATLLIYLTYKMTALIQSQTAGLLVAFFATSSVGFIQFAHFGTFEMWSAFFSTLLLFISLLLLKDYKSRYVLFSGLCLGVLIAIKVSNAALIPLPILSIIYALFTTAKTYENWKDKVKIFIECITQILAVIIVASIIFIVTNPFIIFDTASFKSSMQYESGVALGTMKVFYTQEFLHTIPVLYQLRFVFPFLINPLLLVLFIPSFFILLWKIVKTKNKRYTLLLITFLLILFSEAFFYVKWTRYMVPTLPFIYSILAIILDTFITKIKEKTAFVFSLLFVLISTCSLFAYSYFQTVLTKPDTRIAAADWVATHIPANQHVISEIYDIGIIAFTSIPNNAITLCDMYNLETNPLPCNGLSLNDALNKSEYIILPSERLLKMSLIKKQEYPKRYQLYHELLTDKNKYTLLYKTPCDMYCEILYIGSPLYTFEQTANVFDRPTIYIFKKNTVNM